MNHLPPASAPLNERLFLITLAGMQFTHILDFMIMMPLGPQLIRLLHIDTHAFGLLLSSYTFTAAASGLLATTYIDRFDRRKLTLTLYLLFIAATLFCGLAPNYPALLIARALAGAFGGVLGALVQTMVADVIPFKRRGKAMGTVMTAFSMSTVAGVPLALFLANHIAFLGWRAPFFFIVLISTVFLGIGYRLLPSLTAHMDRAGQGSLTPGNILRQLHVLLKEREHLKAFLFISLIMLSSFTVIPYIALYMTTNVGKSESFITVIYLCGGAATFFTSQWIGRLTDRYGKLAMFRAVAFASFAPLLITTHMRPIPWVLVLLNSTAFFVLISGRMIPGMALLSAVALPQVRGTFMSLLSSVQMLAAGFATLVAGMIITRSASGQIEHYNLVGYLAVACGALTILIARHLRIAPAPPQAPSPTTQDGPPA